MWLFKGGHGRGKTQNGSTVHQVNQDSLLETLIYLKLPPIYMAQKKLLARLWIGIQIVAFVLLLSVSCRAAWVERDLERELSTVKKELQESRQERQEFLRRMRERP